VLGDALSDGLLGDLLPERRQVVQRDRVPNMRQLFGSATDEVASATQEVARGAPLGRTDAGQREVASAPYLQSMKVRKVIIMLKEDGWYLARTRGSHRQFKHDTKPGTVTVAGKPGTDVPPGTLNSILKQAGLKD
jgi:predicted RNA binding protein YcfA (HicA-like mRNA interferase family)